MRSPANDNDDCGAAANDNHTVRTTASGRQYRTVRKLVDYQGSTKARYADIALAVLSSEVAA